MSVANTAGPSLAPASNTAPQTPSPSATSQIELLVTLSLHNWPALTLAIQNAWGGDLQTSADKRDWLAGSISELLLTNQVTHVDDLEEVLLTVMLDEFEVVVDDDSAFDVAQAIWKGIEKIIRGDSIELQAIYNNFLQSGGGKVRGVAGKEDEDGQDTDWDEDDDEGEWNGFQDEDQHMGEAPALVEMSRNKKIVPEVDEDGFTKVMGKKNR